jgi:UPF0148 protein
MFLSGEKLMEQAGDPVKIMAELLKSGAVMLAEICPVEGCNLPLFKLKRSSSGILSNLSLISLAFKTIESLSNTPDVDPTDLIKWLEVVERIQRLRSMIKK